MQAHATLPKAELPTKAHKRSDYPKFFEGKSFHGPAAHVGTLVFSFYAHHESMLVCFQAIYFEHQQ
jgi:hypothetical protein